MTTIHTETVLQSSMAYTELAVPYRFCACEIEEMGYAEHIANLRKQRSLTQAQLAEMVGVEQPTIQRYESGKREPDFEMIHALASALGVLPVEIFLGTPLSDNFDPNEGELAAMIEIAQREIPANASYGDWPRYVASSLQTQLELFRADRRAAARAASSARDKSAQPRRPTKPNASA